MAAAKNRSLLADLSGATKKDIIDLTEAHNVRFLRLMFTDILGVNKNVEIPASQFGKALDGDIMFDGSSIEGFVRIEESDMLLAPDLSTFKIFPGGNPESRVGRLICDVRMPDGKPFAGDPRGVNAPVADTGKAVYGVTIDIGAYEIQAAATGSCPWDTSGDGTVGIQDFLGLLQNWGACP